MTTTRKNKAAPLDEVMLAMDVVDTLRHSENLVARELGEEDRASALMERLREVYRQQGIDVPGQIGLAGFNGVELLDGLPLRLVWLSSR